MPFFDPTPRDRLFYLDENRPASRAVLLLHGLGANSASWQLQIPELVQCDFRAIAVDAPGFGQSPYSGSGWSIPDCATLIHALLQELGLSAVDVVGISMGGAIALQLALDYPQDCSRLVLANTFAHLKVTNPLVMPYFATRFILVHTVGLPTQARQVARRLFPNPEQEPLRQALIDQVLESDPRAYRAAMRAMARFNLQPRLSAIRIPALVISGALDSTVPLSDQADLADGIPGARRVIVPGAGHAITVDHPTEFNHLLFDFLQ